MNLQSSSNLPIAIVGIAAQLPSGNTAQDNLDHKEFFDFLLNKGEAYEKIPADRFNIDSYHGSNAGQVSTERGTFLKRTDHLDHVELGITNKDARAMSLSTRKLIELAFLALLDSGIDYRNQNVGCFASGIIFDTLSLSEADEFEAKGSFGGPPAMIANRISYHLDLVGPSVPVDTACSSSLTATHLAVQAIRSGDCDSAVVGGVQLNHRFVDWVQYSQGGILAPDGKCKPFDVSANGFSRGEAGVVIVLKRLDHAVRDGDHIYASILGTGINSAGQAAPVNAPVAAAQRDAMRRAWAQTGRQPNEVDFVELHATGTAAGDPAEANWVGEAFQKNRKEELLIGSVKGNIGHTEITAFLSSLTKVINVFRTHTIPPNVNLRKPNPRIKWDEYRLRVPTQAVPLPCQAPSGQALVALCSSGIGGANGHVVVEAPPPSIQKLGASAGSDNSQRPVLLVAGGLSPRTASAISDTLTDLVTSNPGREAFLSTVYGRRSRQMTWRSFATYTPGQSGKVKFSQPTLVPRTKPPVAFVFAGQGPQHLDMGRELFQAYPAFRESILEMDSVYQQVTGTSLIASTGLFHKDGPSSVALGSVWPIEITLPALAMLQCAVVDLLASVGVTPDMVVGHSAGETAVFYASGAGSKAMVVELAVARGQAMALVEKSGGTMAAVSCGIADAQAIIFQALGAELAATVDIACHNSRDAVTVAGLETSIDKVVALAESRGIMARKLRTRVPVHSGMMELCRSEFTSAVDRVWARYPGSHEPQIAVYSTLKGGLLADAFTSDYFWDGTRGPVLFTEAVTALVEQHPTATFLEVSPHPVLSSYLSDLGASNVISPLRRPKRNESAPVEVPSFLEGLGRFSALGHNAVNFSALNDHPALDTDFALPAYPFAPKAIPYHAESVSFYRPFQGRKGPLNYPGLRVNSQTHPVLAQHVIKGEPIMPAAGFIEMALEFGAVVLWDVEFRSMLSLSGENPTPVQVELDGIHWSVKTSTASAAVRKGQEAVFDKVHAQGYLSLEAPRSEYKPLDLGNIFKRCKRVDLTNFYEELKTFAEYGPAFQRVVDGYQGDNEVLVLVRGADELLDVEGYCFHPAILDCCLHFMVHKSFTLSNDANIYYLPSKVGKFVVHGEMVDAGLPDHVYAHIVFKHWTPTTIVGDFHIVAIDGTRLCTLTDVEVERHESSPRVDVAQRYDVVFQPLAIPATTTEEQDLVVPGNENMYLFYQYLDYLASQAIINTLNKRPVAGKELDRKRYMEFANAVAKSPVPMPAIDEETIVEMRQMRPEMFEITDRISSVHEKIFESSKAAVEILYKDDLMTRYYKHYDWASKACADRFRSLLSTIIESGKQVINVLEVGSGTGALTRHLADVMAEFPEVVIEFVITDVSKELLPRVSYPRCRYKAFDLSKPIEEQGFNPATFDIITGFNVLHVVEAMAPSLATLNQMLVPGGNILIGDLNGDSWTARAPGSIWFDLVFGCFSEWFSFTDFRAHCSLSAQQWRQCLYTAGFGHVTTASFASDPLLFTLQAQKVQTIASLPAREAGQENMLLFPYQRGNEIDLRVKLAPRDASSPLSLWIYSNSGFDGDAGIGFSRSLAREYAFWKVYFVIFDGVWSEQARLDFISELSCTPGTESVLFVNDKREISVPRVIPSAGPSGQCYFDPALPWTYSDSEVVQSSIPPHGDGLATIQVLAVSRPEAELRGFVGRIALDSGAPLFAENDLVFGVIASSDISNYITVKTASLAGLPASAEGLASEIAGAALGLVIGGLACGVSKLRSSRRRQGGKAFITHASPVIEPSLKWLLQILGYNILETKSDSPADIATVAAKADLIVSGSDSRFDLQAYSGAVARNGRVFMWNDARVGLSSLLKNDPTAVGEALELVVERVAGHWPHNTKGIHLADISLPASGTLISSSASLFDPRKAYVLIGGVGGLGIRIALWMYEKGARYIVLTSRSGKDSLSRVQDLLALRIVTYLESLPDLTFRIEASDATSEQSTTALLQSIPIPLGGCMLLSVVLSDRTFAFQDEDGFRKVFASKTGACNVFANCIPNGVASLDFFVSFSSVVGLFGNGGQTNYSSANTALDGMVRDWDNAFTFVLPAISDGGGLASETREQGGRLGHLTPWGMPVQRICDCLEDGIRKLADGNFWQYIPDLDWVKVQGNMGSAALYEHLVDANSDDEVSQTVESGNSMVDVVRELLDVDVDDFSVDVPFTAYGLDSLSAARLSFALRPFVTISQLQLLSDVTLNDLYARIEKAQEEKPSETETTASSPKVVEPSTAEMDNLISKYTSNFPKHVSCGVSPRDEVVLITGTTGAIGASMLSQLASIPSISRIYALNRAGSGDALPLRQRQMASLESRGYDSGILEQGKIELVEGDQSKHGFGISPQLYEEIRSSVTVIVHNAWPVNFTTSLASLEPAVRSVRVMVDLALASPHDVPPRLLFLSSIGLMYNREGEGFAPEEPIADPRQVIGTGYSESKFVGERILERAAQETSLRPTIVRAGQICGGPNGSWNSTEWFPSLVKSSIHLGCLPGMDGDISWLPLHTAAKALVEMRDAEQQTLHLSHPRPVAWSHIAEFLSKTLKLPLVSYNEWLSRLEKSASGASSASPTPGDGSNPALGLLDYFRSLESKPTTAKEALGLPKLSVVEGSKASSALRDAEPLSSQEAAQWLTSWRHTGFLRF